MKPVEKSLANAMRNNKKLLDKGQLKDPQHGKLLKGCVDAQKAFEKEMQAVLKNAKGTRQVDTSKALKARQAFEAQANAYAKYKVKEAAANARQAVNDAAVAQMLGADKTAEQALQRASAEVQKMCSVVLGQYQKAAGRQGAGANLPEPLKISILNAVAAKQLLGVSGGNADKLEKAMNELLRAGAFRGKKLPR